MITLKTFEKADISELLGWIKDTDTEFLMQFAGPRYKFPLDEKQLLDTLSDKSSLIFKAIDERTGAAIGHCQLMRIDTENKSASIGRILIKQDNCGMGYGYTMLKELMKFAENDLKLEKLSLKVFDFNKSAVRCYQKSGFVESKREDVFFGGINKTWNCITMDYTIS